MLSRHVAKVETKHQKKLNPAYATRYQEANNPTPKYELPPNQMSSAGAYQMIRDKLVLDGNPVLNLASFVTTWVEPEAQQLFTECSNKNIADQLQYPKSNEIQDLCINILANLYHAPDPVMNSTASSSSAAAASAGMKTLSEEIEASDPGCIGTSTVGSSEAILLGGLAMKWRWREKMAKKRGCKPEECLDKLNVVLSTASHVSLLKFCLYFDVEPRMVPIHEGHYTMDNKKAVELCDEFTIGIYAILGNTLTGEFDDILALSKALDALQKEKEWDIPIHVDAASGGFVAPFLAPKIEWDFRVPRVRSINVSGHKFGLVSPGLGWILYRTKADLPANLVFHINYLGADEPTFSLNFSKPASQVVQQYYNFLRLGFEGYQRIVQQCTSNAAFVAERLSKSGFFTLLSKHDTPALPVVVFRFAMDTKKLGFDEKRLVREVQRHGWILPAYQLSKDCEQMTVIRCVCRESLTMDMAEQLLEAIGQELESLIMEFCKDESILKEHTSKLGDIKKKMMGGQVTGHRGGAIHRHLKPDHKAKIEGLTHTIC